MEQYILKSALITRIKKLQMDIGNIFNEYDEGFWEGRNTAFDDVICILDTFEVKDVDLKKEYKEFVDCDNGRSMFETAKHFFEFGLKVQKGE